MWPQRVGHTPAASDVAPQSKIEAMARLARYSWVVLIYNLAVIAWGAYVRATGSGAGCGSHWPLCNGEVVPRAQTVEMLVEFSHRATSGLALVSVVVLLAWAWRVTAPGHPVRTGATLSVAFMLSEALLGAGLVLFGLVGKDDSSIRAFVVSAHLINTFLLLASLTLTVWWAEGGERLSLAGRDGLLRLAVGALAILLVSCSGAITALGDTLFPSASLGDALRADVAAGSPVLLRLRTLHPVLAVMTALFLMTAVWRLAAGRPYGVKMARLLTWLLGVQLLAGMLNVLLLAPVWMQLLHLLLADIVWIAYLFLGADVLSSPVRAQSAPASTPYATPA